MIHAKDIRNAEVTFHRNGTSGAPFHSVRFDFTEDGRSHKLLAIVLPEPGHVAVVSLVGGEHWRGDNFEQALMTVCYGDDIVQALAAGHTTPEEIADYTGMDVEIVGMVLRERNYRTADETNE
jgi:hypothetical protein